MEYLSSEQLFKYFEKEINETSKKKIDALKSEISAIKQNELKKIDDDLKESIDHDLELELKDLKTDHSYEMNRILTENAKELMNRRQELFVSVFDAVREKLNDFVVSNEYTFLMTKKVANLSTVFKNDEIIFQVKKNDQLIKSVIEKTFQGKYKIDISNQIMIGGFFAACLDKGIELDESLDTLLEDKKQWFYEKSNLFINK